MSDQNELVWSSLTIFRFRRSFECQLWLDVSHMLPKTKWEGENEGTDLKDTSNGVSTQSCLKSKS